MADLGAFLSPLGEGSPSGVELRNDLRFHAIERQILPASRQGRKDAQANGKSDAVAINWDQVLDDARDLATAGRDLRLLVVVVRALTNAEGPSGLADGLTLLTNTVQTHWDSLHPALRESPSRREAATRRINALYQIESNEDGILGDLDFLVVLNARGLGPVTVGDLAAALLNQSQVLASSPGIGTKEQAEIMAAHETRAKRAFVSCKTYAAERPDEIAALTASLRTALTQLGALEKALDERVAEGGVGVKFKILDQTLSRAIQTLATYGVTSEAATVAPPSTAEAASGGAALNGAQPVQNGAARTATGLPSQVNSRREVEQCLDLIIDFYERTEPSSPIPHLARRMRKMVPMNFMQLMEEIAPSGMKEFRNVAGVFEEKAK